MIIHVTPINDIKPHEDATTCPCGPRIEEEQGSLICIHNSWDGREGVEWANEILQASL